MDKVCGSCMRRSKKEKWYPFQCTKTVSVAECSFHPILTNWRVVRTLKTIRAWSLEPDGATVALSVTCRMPVQLGGGHIHERTARAKLFDYEGPFLDLLVESGLLARHDGFREHQSTAPTTLTVTPKGDDFIRLDLLEKEAKGGVKNTAHFLRNQNEG